MKRAARSAAVVGCALLSGTLTTQPAMHARTVDGPSGAQTALAKDKARLLDAYGMGPLSFEPNRGQTDPQVKFLSRGNGYTVFLTSNEAVLTFEQPSRKASTLRMTLVGGRATPAVAGLDELPGRSNYFIGRNSASWHTGIPTYGKVRYQEAYPGIDLIYYGHGRELEYDFVVAPGADPRVITLGFDGAAKMEIDRRGDLVLQSGSGDARFHKPVMYQPPADGADRTEVQGRYVRKSKNKVGFEIVSYDPTKPLIIDPTLSYSTYFGGNHDDLSAEVAVDGAGHVYVSGYTNSTANFPLVNAEQPSFHGPSYGYDVFVAALDPTSGTLLYSTYLGGSDDDSGFGLAADNAGNAYVTGRTRSTDFPVLNAVQPVPGGGYGDAFLARFDQGGALLFSTYLGGSDIDFANGVAVDGVGNVHVTGFTQSIDFPTVNAWQPANSGQGDIFVAAFDASGVGMLYATYLGGTSGDYAYAIAVDTAGDAYVTGYTASTDFPTVNAAQSAHHGPAAGDDAFVAAFDPTGSSLRYSTYLGGAGDDWATGIGVDAAGRAYVTGGTNSTDFPTVNAFQGANAGGNAFPGNGFGGQDAFVAALDSSGASLLYSTYLGGNEYESATRIGVDAAGNAWVVGATNSTDFPTVNPLQPSNHGGPVSYYGEPIRPNGGWDAFITNLDPTGGPQLSTYLGGTDHDYGSGIAVDDAGNAYVTGYTLSTDFPTMNSSQPKNTEIDPDHPSPNWDAFLTALTPDFSPPPPIPADAPAITPAGGTFNQPLSATLTTMTSGATMYFTTDGSTPTTSSPSYTGPIAVTRTMTIHAIAAASGMLDSTVSSATFTLRAAAPTLNPRGGSYLLPQRVSLSDASPGTTIYYTTNGSTPTISSTRYTSPILVLKTTTIKAIAVAAGWSQSPVASATYRMLLP